MSAIPTYFNDFLANIRLPDDLKAELIAAHTTLRERLKTDEFTKDMLVESFLQGSYARSTCIKPEHGKKVDVDVIAVTNIDHNTVSAKEAFSIIIPFVEKYYEDYQQQKRSVGISLPKVDVDLVITAAPSEEVKREIKSADLASAFTVDDLSGYEKPILESYRLDSLKTFFRSDAGDQQWRTEPLLIPDNDKDEWYRTHPLEQIRWTKEKNQLCNGNYVNVVKAVKWWRRLELPDLKHPKSYPLEHFVGNCCPNGITSVAEGVVRTLEHIALHYPTKPVLPDRGVPEHDVFETLIDTDYQTFYKAVCRSARIARAAYDSDNPEESVRLWRMFFKDCEEFPCYHGKPRGFTPRVQRTETVPVGRFG